LHDSVNGSVFDTQLLQGWLHGKAPHGFVSGPGTLQFQFCMMTLHCNSRSHTTVCVIKLLGTPKKC